MSTTLYLLTPTVIGDAIRMVEPGAIGLMGANIGKRKILAGAIRIDSRPELDRDFWYKLDLEAETDPRFMAIGRGKAALSLREQMSTGLIVTQYPHLLLPEDPKYPGGVYKAKIAVGCSAWDSWFDEMVAWWLVEAIIARTKMTFNTRVVPAAGDFINDCLSAG